MIFQDPYASLNPRMKIRGHLTDPLLIHGLAENDKWLLSNSSTDYLIS